MSGGSFRLLLGYSWIREQCQNSRTECIFKRKQSGKIWKSHSLAQEGWKKKWGLPLRKCLLKRLVAQKQVSALHLNKEKDLEGISLFTKAAPPFTATGHLGKRFLWNHKAFRIWKYLLSVDLYVSVCGHSQDPGVRCPRAGFAGDCGFWEPNRAEKQELLTSSFQPKRMGSLLEPSVAQGFWQRTTRPL